MIEKILSCGRRGAERAALEVALEAGISPAGWVPADLSADRTVFAGLVEMTGAAFSDCLEKNVAESDGTLIITFGRPSGDSDLARRLSLQHRRQLLHIDAARTDIADAAELIRSWIEVYRISALHVTGTDAKHAEDLYAAAVHMLVFVVEAMQRQILQPARRVYPLAPASRPCTLEQAVQRLAGEMALRDKAAIANAGPDDVQRRLEPLIDSVVTRLGLTTGNEALMESCRFARRTPQINPEEAAYFILRSLWRSLQATHSIRMVK